MNRTQKDMSRRTFISATAAGAVISAVNVHGQTDEPAPKLKGHIKQSVSRWCFGKIDFNEFAQYCRRIGIQSIELVGPEDWQILKKHSLICAMTPSHGITKGLNRRENHAECLTAIRKSIDTTAEAGFPNVICFSGNRDGMDDEQGLDNCEIAIKQVVGYAEQKNVTLCMELLNSKRNHKDYMCDHTAWGGQLVRRIGSDRFKLLYDIYHMQVQEGDVIVNIQEYADCIGHYHTAGVPGRHEIDASQELNYPAIMEAIVKTGYQGYVGHEFVPQKDPLTSLEQAVQLCDV